jgi:hypothetical protein
MSTDNRTIINDCEANTGWAGDDTATVITDAGQFYQGSAALSTQLSNADEHMYTTRDSVGAGTFSLDWSDSTLYMLIKDNLQQTAANGGVQFVIGDGTNRPGYDIGGNDAVGMPLPTYFNCYKLDVSVIVATPGTFTDFAGIEASMAQTTCTQIGYGTIHLAKAVGAVDNAFMDCFRYIANDSYALTINGGTAGTPETMSDVAGDDVTNGWGMISNPLGDLYYFFAPTEWGEASASADHYFSADGEQWFWLGDNGGGHAVGSTHFPFRVIGNATDTGSFVIDNVVIVNTGTGSEFDCSDTNIDTLEIDGCSMSGLASFSAPSSGGTSRFCTNTIFSNCGVITHNGASMNGSSVLTSTVVADEGALFYDETVDPDGEMDGMIFSKGTNAHHAIRFGANVPATMTLRNCNFTGFGSTDDANDSVFRFDDTTGSITLNLVGCTTDGTFSVDDAAGVTVTVVIDPVTTLINVKDNDGVNLQNAMVYFRASDGTGDLPFEESVTITRAGTTATVSHTAHGLNTNEYVKISGITDKTEDNAGAHQITVLTANSYTYTTTDSGSTSYTGTIIATGALIYGLTDASGNISSSRTLTLDQPLEGFVRKSTSSPRFKSFPITGTVDNANGLTINVRLVLDE